ncbi:CAP domain-containing protein [Sporichthya polymorpha]|uniref:CAP domain-containing protein n=1 Tax=Sporichthya polymorpha TaxID=35751 RepID=UPI000360AD9A|nr:CAP domain-containing protein [Sporichthya polymorpha]
MSHARLSLARTGAAAAVLTLTALTPALTASSAEAASVSGSTRAELRTDVVASVNAARAKAGCKPLKVSSQLTTAAQRHADDMVRTNLFSHTSANGRSWITRIKKAGFKKPGGENIARGHTSTERVMTAWLKSPGHRANILNCKFRQIGVGHNANGNYWVQDFGY